MLLLIAMAVLQLTVEQTFADVFRLFPSNTENQLTLVCEFSSGANSPEQLSFYFNDELLPNSAPNNRITISLNFDNDGFYSCGNASCRSTPQLQLPVYNLVGSQYIPNNEKGRVEYAKVGTEFRIAPYLKPGNAISSYSMNWRRGLITLASTTRPNQPGYFVDPESFHLVIETVTIADEGDYFGVLGAVVNSGQITYSETRENNITVKVFESAVITRGPREVIVSDPYTDTATFDCEARGHPTPQITWNYNSQSIDSSDVNIETSETGDTILSQITLRNDFVNRNGMVTCIAAVVIDNRSDLDNPPAEESSHVTLLEIGNAIVYQSLHATTILIELKEEMIGGDVKLYLQDTNTLLRGTCNQGRTWVYILTREISTDTRVAVEFNGTRSLTRKLDLPQGECERKFLTIVIPCAIAGTVLIVLAVIIAVLMCAFKCCSMHTRLQLAALNNASPKTQTQVVGSIASVEYNHQPRSVHIGPDYSPHHFPPQTSHNPSYGSRSGNNTPSRSNLSVGQEQLSDTTNTYEQIPLGPTNISNSIRSPGEQSTQQPNSYEQNGHGSPQQANGQVPPPPNNNNTSNCSPHDLGTNGHCNGNHGNNRSPVTDCNETPPIGRVREKGKRVRKTYKCLSYEDAKAEIDRINS